MTGGTAVDAVRETFVHPALFYRDDHDYLAGTVPFVTEGLAGDEPVAVSVPPARLAVLRRALGTAAERVHMLDMTEVGRNPGGSFPACCGPSLTRIPDNMSESSANRSGRSAPRRNIRPAPSTKR